MTPENGWRLWIYGPDRIDNISEVHIASELTAAQISQLPIGAKVEMTVVGKKRESLES